MAKLIYGLFYVEAGETRYFYVGRSKNLTRRMREHSYAKKTGHEDKYEFIRQLEARGIKWEDAVLDTVADHEFFADAERWQVIALTRDGHELMNMRHGSREHRKELAEQVKLRSIRNAEDVRTDRMDRKFHASRRLRRQIWIKTLRDEGIPNVAADRVLPDVIRRKLLAVAATAGRDGRISVEPWGRNDFKDFISLVRSPLSWSRELKNLREQVIPQAGD